MKPSSKTPYEIRLELLQLAFDVLQAQHIAKAGSKAKSGQWRGEVVETAPTTEEVIAEAEKMNTFISKANPTH